jgi:hypothetical protein
MESHNKQSKSRRSVINETTANQGEINLEGMENDEKETKGKRVLSHKPNKDKSNKDEVQKTDKKQI